MPFPFARAVLATGVLFAAAATPAGAADAFPAKPIRFVVPPAA